MRQADAFLAGEGAAWLERNRDKLGAHDPVSDMITSIGITPTSILEIGCANGWRLDRLRERFDCRAVGVDPGATGHDRYVTRGVATALPFDAMPPFDLVIFGFCLYLIDPEDYFTVAAEADRVLADGGYLVIHDFNFESDVAYKRAYAHRDGLWSHHADFEMLWLAHPHYKYVTCGGWEDDYSLVTVLRKGTEDAFEVRP